MVISVLRVLPLQTWFDIMGWGIERDNSLSDRGSTEDRK